MLRSFWFAESFSNRSLAAVLLLDFAWFGTNAFAFITLQADHRWNKGKGTGMPILSSLLFLLFLAQAVFPLVLVEHHHLRLPRGPATNPLILGVMASVFVAPVICPLIGYILSRGESDERKSTAMVGMMIGVIVSLTAIQTARKLMIEFWVG